MVCRKLKEKRKKLQEANKKRKEEEKEKLKEKSLQGMRKDKVEGDGNTAEIEDDDKEYYREEVGEEPDEGCCAIFS